MLAEINLVGVKDENLLLEESVLEDHGENDFLDFSPNRTTGC